MPDAISRSSFRFAPLFAMALAACAPPSPEDDLGDKSAEIDGALRVCGNGNSVEGVDVSRWQSQIDWDKVATTPVKFALIRVSDGGNLKSINGGPVSLLLAPIGWHNK